MSIDGVRITNREIYVAIQEVKAVLEKHVVEDEQRFANLNVKFYGILGGVLVSIVTFLAGATNAFHH